MSEYQEINEGYNKEFNDDNKLNKMKRRDIERSLDYYKDNLEYCRNRNSEYNEKNRERIRENATRRYYWHRSWGGDAFCQFSLLKISLEAFK